MPKELSESELRSSEVDRGRFLAKKRGVAYLMNEVTTMALLLFRNADRLHSGEVWTRLVLMLKA